MLLGGISSALFFLEPDPWKGDKKEFIALLGLIIGLIYTLDHLADGYKFKGRSGILRYDYHYRYRHALIILVVLIGVLVGFLLWRVRDASFVSDGVLLLPVLGIYFVLKMRGLLPPLAKMLVISVIISSVVVSLYRENQFFMALFSLDRIAMTLLVLLNMLVLEHYESHEEFAHLQPEDQEIYARLSKRVFIWLLAILLLILLLNPFAWPYILTMGIIAVFLRRVVLAGNVFGRERRYRYWADFAFIMMWPLLRLFLFIGATLKEML